MSVMEDNRFSDLACGCRYEFSFVRQENVIFLPLYTLATPEISLECNLPVALYEPQRLDFHRYINLKG